MTSKEALLKLCFKYLPMIDEMYLNLDEEDIVLLKIIEKDLEIAEFVKDYVNSTKTTLGWSYSKQLEFFSSLEKLVEETSEIEKELENEK